MEFEQLIQSGDHMASRDSGMRVDMDHALLHSVVVSGTMSGMQADVSGPHEQPQNEDDDEDGEDKRTGRVDDTNNLTVVGAWTTAGCMEDKETMT